MTYLDVNPVMDALRTTPEDFSLSGKWLSHRGSRHAFGFNDEGRVQIRAACECAFLQVKPEQERALYECYRVWEASYWRPLRINREFAIHFQHHSWRGAVIRLATRLAMSLAEETLEIKNGKSPFFSKGRSVLRH